MNVGKVYIMGVGPGDYKLITIKALEKIKEADVIVYDRLVDKRILKYAKKNVEMIYVGKKPDKHIVPQGEINKILVKKALEGKIVARVKGGDPFVFGRGGEEAKTLVENSIKFEIIPGITSAISVPAYSGIPVTHRDYCSSFHIITGHENPDKEGSSLNYKVLAQLEGTLVFLMGVKNLSEITKNLIINGKDKETPVAVIQNGTTFKQKRVIGTLENIVQKITEAKIKSPAITIIGKVVNLSTTLDWFPYGELAGKRVLVTRSRQQSSKLVESIEKLGGQAIEFPVIKVEKPDNYELIDSALDNLEIYNWLVFTSPNGVNTFFQRLKDKGIDIRKLYPLKIAAVGKATAIEIENKGIFVDFIPKTYTTNELLNGLIEILSKDDRVLIARSDLANNELPEGIKAKGIMVTDAVIYKIVPDTSESEEIYKLIDDGNVDYITFTSSSTVQNFLNVLGKENLNKLEGIKAICIGPVTEKTAKECGIKVFATADEYTIDGLLKTLIKGG